jgi:hypothetical protein
MENIPDLKNGCIKDLRGETQKDTETLFHANAAFRPSIVTLIAEVGITCFRYLKSLGLSGETNLIVLSSKDNYSIRESDLKNVRILVNLKKLNLIKHLDIFLNSLVLILPPDTSFIGYFSAKPRHFDLGFHLKKFLKFFIGFNSFPGSGRGHILNRDEVMELLERNGFETIGMKEMNGLTYFISQNVRGSIQ